MRLRLACAVLVAAASVRAAAAADLPADMDARVAEGKKWFQVAGNTDLGTAERNAARVNSWKSLWPAKEALDAVEDERPSEAERLEAKFGEIRMMVYCLRKESPIGLLNSSGVGPGSGGGAAASPEEGDEDPPAAAPAPATPPPPSPGQPPAPQPPPPAAASKAVAPGTPSVESLFANAQEYERRHRFDLPGIHARYLRVVTTCPDLSQDLVRKAAEKAGDLEGRLKDAYRLLRNEDPDALQGATNVRIKAMVLTVARDLSSRDAALRERAARILGLLGHPEAVYDLSKALDKETEEAPAAAAIEALGRIGGTKGATALADLRSDDRYASRALDALIALSKRNPVDRRIAAKQMGRFVGAKDEALFDRMLAAFKGMGMDGLLGLQACCENNTTADRLIDVIGRLSESKEPAVARVLSRYLQQGRGPDDARIRDAAMNGIRKMAQPKNVGDAVVPHLFPAVRNKFTRFYATQMLQEITHQLIDIRHYTSWSTWWRSTHPDWKEKENDD